MKKFFNILLAIILIYVFTLGVQTLVTKVIDSHNAEVVETSMRKIQSVNNCSVSTNIHILYIVKQLEKEGYKTPPNYTCNNKLAQTLTTRPIKSTGGFFYYPYNLVYINEKSTEVNAVLLHEIGHYNHYLNVGDNKFDKIMREPVDPILKKVIEEEISEYATTSKAEFVAEYFMYKHLGFKFSSSIDNYYKECGGV